jgi:hypothetical protein
MNIIIPLGGKGERFKNNGYIEPKPLHRPKRKMRQTFYKK